jgi:hypothetical protein
MAFKYQRRDTADWEKRASQQGGDYQGFIKDDYKTFTPAKGDNFLRILPPTWENAAHYGLDIYVHYGVGPERATVLCLSKMKQQRCPICEAALKAQKAGDDELHDELKAGKRVLVWMFDRKEEAKGPMLWSMPWTLDRDFCKLARDPRSGEVYTLDDPDDGYDISFEKTGEKQQTKYVGNQLARRPSSVPQDFVDYVVEFPIPETLIWRDAAELQKLYEGSAAYSADDAGPSAREREPAPRERERARDPEPERERRPDARDARDEAPKERERFRPRGSDRDPPPETRRDDPPREPAGAKHGIDDDIPWTRDRDEAAGHTNGRDPAPRERERARDPEPEARREPEPRRDDPPPASPSGKSRAQELRERFGRR